MSKQRLISKNLCIDREWTLFLDRDGVINAKIEGDYVRTWSQFKFLPGVRESIGILSKIFSRIVVVTNQRGVASHLMTESDLLQISDNMTKQINDAGGRIDKVYACCHSVEDRCECRKPKIGLALYAKADFPDIVFSKSIVIGDELSDMTFGKRLGMQTVLMRTEGINGVDTGLIDVFCKDLPHFAKYLIE